MAPNAFSACSSPTNASRRKKKNVTFCQCVAWPVNGAPDRKSGTAL